MDLFTLLAAPGDHFVLGLYPICEPVVSVVSSHEKAEERIFQECIELPPAERVPFIEKTCQGDPELRDNLISLILSHETSGGFMSTHHDLDALGTKDKLEKIAPSHESPGDRIGRYQLLELLGEGASGSVWMALQTEDIERRVALKILKLGMDTKEFLARFEAERQMLAMMDHPNVARVLDAGATDYGRPYFVMDLVKGIPLQEYCDLKRLNIEERVKLCIKICHGLEHAHQKGIVHRDLKPSNILVGVQNDEPDPRIIDFGIAKTTNMRLTDKTLFTGIHTFLGTPVYSSPEQLEGNSIEVNHRSDIYSMGALLYEILVGIPPFDHQKLAKLGLKDLQTFVREKEPVLPSVRYRDLPLDDQMDLSFKRQTDRGRMQSLLKGDLDWIILKCLEKDPSRRYETALDLWQDLEAYLEGQPVTAAAPSVTYQVKKFIQRKRPAYAIWLEVTALVLLILLGYSYFRSPSTLASNPSSLEFRDISIAIVPFENLTSDPENGFFADGVREDINMHLGGNQEMLVIGGPTMNRYRDTTLSDIELGNQLGVRFLLEGNIRRESDRVLLSVKLVDAQTGHQSWSGYFESELDVDDSFGAQRRLASRIAGQIKGVLSPGE